jgi:hypothetical protein
MHGRLRRNLVVGIPALARILRCKETDSTAHCQNRALRHGPHPPRQPSPPPPCLQNVWEETSQYECCGVGYLREGPISQPPHLGWCCQRAPRRSRRWRRSPRPCNNRGGSYAHSVRSGCCNVNGHEAQCESTGVLLDPLDVRHMPHTSLRPFQTRLEQGMYPLAPTNDIRPFRGGVYSPHYVAVG